MAINSDHGDIEQQGDVSFPVVFFPKDVHVVSGADETGKRRPRICVNRNGAASFRDRQGELIYLEGLFDICPQDRFTLGNLHFRSGAKQELKIRRRNVPATFPSGRDRFLCQVFQGKHRTGGDRVGRHDNFRGSGFSQDLFFHCRDPLFGEEDGQQRQQHSGNERKKPLHLIFPAAGRRGSFLLSLPERQWMSPFLRDLCRCKTAFRVPRHLRTSSLPRQALSWHPLSPERFSRRRFRSIRPRIPFAGCSPHENRTGGESAGNDVSQEFPTGCLRCIHPDPWVPEGSAGYRSPVCIIPPAGGNRC